MKGLHPPPERSLEELTLRSIRVPATNLHLLPLRPLHSGASSSSPKLPHSRLSFLLPADPGPLLTVHARPAGNLKRQIGRHSPAFARLWFHALSHRHRSRGFILKHRKPNGAPGPAVRFSWAVCPPHVTLVTFMPPFIGPFKILCFYPCYSLCLKHLKDSLYKLLISVASSSGDNE